MISKLVQGIKSPIFIKNTFLTEMINLVDLRSILQLELIIF